MQRPDLADRADQGRLADSEAAGDQDLQGEAAESAVSSWLSCPRARRTSITSLPDGLGAPAGSSIASAPPMLVGQLGGRDGPADPHKARPSRSPRSTRTTPTGRSASADEFRDGLDLVHGTGPSSAGARGRGALADGSPAPSAAVTSAIRSNRTPGVRARPAAGHRVRADQWSRLGVVPVTPRPCTRTLPPGYSAPASRRHPVLAHPHVPVLSPSPVARRASPEWRGVRPPVSPAAPSRTPRGRCPRTPCTVR